MIRVPIETVALRFQKFATETVVMASSPLYTHLSMGIAELPHILALVTEHQEGQPEPNLLFGAVHQLLLSGINHPLQAFFADTGASAPEDALPAFEDFCMNHADAILQIVRTRLVQTNEVGRSALLLPAFYHIFQQSNIPLALLEVGASAGLNLHFDRYYVQYINGIDYVPMENTAINLTCEVRGNYALPLMNKPLPIAYRMGIDLNPLDVVNNRDDEAWLRALIWPQDTARVSRYTGAVATMKHHPISLVAGNALEILPQVLNEIPLDTMLCVFHSFVLYQFSPAMKDAFFAIIAEHSLKRPIYDLTLEGVDNQTYEMHLRHYQNGLYTTTKLANINAHGKFIEWTNVG